MVGSEEVLLGKKDREYAVGSWLAADKFVVMK